MVWFEWLRGAVGADVVATLAAVAVAVALGALVRLLARRVEDHASRGFLIKTVDYILAIITLAVIAKIWIRSINIGALLGLTAAGLVLALKEPVANVAGWLFILVRHPLRVGDRIQVGNLAGDVVDIRLMMFTLLEIGNWIAGDQATGRVVHVPNSVVFTQPVANYMQAFRHIWHELHVHITYESDWKRAEEILLGILERHATDPEDKALRRPDERDADYLRFFRELEPNVWLSVTRTSVRLSMRYLCDPRKRRASERAIWHDVLDAFAAEPRIALAYPTRRFYDNAAEGRVRSGPPGSVM